MILTEEELRYREAIFQHEYMGSIMSKKPYQYTEEIIASHRELFKANAGLSYKNMKYKQAFEHILEYWNRDENENAMSNALWEIIDTATEALEELK